MNLKCNPSFYEQLTVILVSFLVGTQPKKNCYGTLAQLSYFLIYEQCTDRQTSTYKQIRKGKAFSACMMPMHHISLKLRNNLNKINLISLYCPYVE